MENLHESLHQAFMIAKSSMAIVARRVYAAELIEIGKLKTLFEQLYLALAHRKITSLIAFSLMKILSCNL